MRATLLFVLWLTALPAIGQTTPQTVLFDPTFRPQPARIVSQQEMVSLRAPTALVRLPNGKLAIMVRDPAGNPQPFYARGIENGFRPLPPGADFDKLFANYRRLGANTALFMIHWMEIEPADGKFDFSRTDQIVEMAKKNGVKLWWVLFLHCQSDHQKELSDFWLYRSDSRDGKDYAMQWLKDENGVVYDSMAKLKTLPGRWEIFPAYGSPQVLPKINRMLTKLGERYRDSDTVIGIQIDNESGFGFYTPRGTTGPQKLQSDFNPVTAQIFEEWKLKTGKSDWHAFKLAIVKYWWKQFTTAFHKGDPYKLTSFNFQGANAATGDETWIDKEAVDVTTYGEGNIDAISSNFYLPVKGPKVWANLDQHYNVAYELPIFLTAEIGLGRTWPAVQFQQYVINCIERGAQGYSSYGYGDLMGTDGNPNTYGEFYRSFASMIEANEDMIHAGVPGPGPVSITTSSAGYKISQLGVTQTGTVGILHFPSAFAQTPEPSQAKADVSVELKALVAGSYVVQTYREGKVATSSTLNLGANEATRFVVPGAGQTEAVFIKVKRQGA